MSGSTPIYRPSSLPPRAEIKRTGDRDYNLRRRNPEARRFYNSRAWRNARNHVLASSPLCVDCLEADRTTVASEVHHNIELLEDWSRALDDANLVPLCGPCHNRRRSAVLPPPSPGVYQRASLP